jgi:2-polyprenyl-3-methyl-5-hydroxy-6-metoxy-1,4-benzoquinol methylase
MSERIIIRNIRRTLMNLENSNYVIQNHIARYQYAIKLIKSKKIVVDIACGSGYGSKMIAMKDNKVFAIDNSKQALNLSKKFNYHKNIQWILGNIKNISKIVTEKVDAIVCFETLEHIEKNHDMVLKQFNNILKENAPAICSVPLNHRLNKWHKKVFNFQEREDLFKKHFKNITYSDENKSIIVGWK